MGIYVYDHWFSPHRREIVGGGGGGEANLKSLCLITMCRNFLSGKENFTLKFCIEESCKYFLERFQTKNSIQEDLDEFLWGSNVIEEKVMVWYILL